MAWDGMLTVAAAVWMDWSRVLQAFKSILAAGQWVLLLPRRVLERVTGKITRIGDQRADVQQLIENGEVLFIDNNSKTIYVDPSRNSGDGSGDDDDGNNNNDNNTNTDIKERSKEKALVRRQWPWQRRNQRVCTADDSEQQMGVAGDGRAMIVSPSPSIDPRHVSQPVCMAHYQSLGTTVVDASPPPSIRQDSAYMFVVGTVVLLACTFLWCKRRLNRRQAGAPGEEEAPPFLSQGALFYREWDGKPSDGIGQRAERSWSDCGRSASAAVRFEEIFSPRARAGEERNLPERERTRLASGTFLFCTHTREILKREGVQFLADAAKLGDDVEVEESWMMELGGRAQFTRMMYVDATKDEKVLRLTENKGLLVKQLRDRTDELANQRFVNEMKAFIKINNGHLNIIPVYSMDHLSHTIVTHRAHSTLYLKLRNGIWDVAMARRMRLMAQGLSALNFLHKERRLAHGDFKPQNIAMNEAMSLIWLQDFRAAGVIDEEVVSCGTHAYFAPEAASGFQTAKISAAMDKYAVGLVLLQLIAGTHAPATLVKVILESLLSIDPSKRMELDSLQTFCMSEDLWAPVASDNSMPDLPKDIEGKIDKVRQLLRSR